MASGPVFTPRRLAKARRGRATAGDLVNAAGPATKKNEGGEARWRTGPTFTVNRAGR